MARTLHPKMGGAILSVIVGLFLNGGQGDDAA
jgi:hypothetical protein